MHRLFWPAAALVAIAVLIQIVSLFGFRYVTSDRAAMVQLQNGRISVWRAEPATLDFIGAGFSGTRTYTGLNWSFNRKSGERVWVPVGPGSTQAKRSSHSGFAAPALLVLVLPAVGLASPPIIARGRRLARRRRGACLKCGYDLRGLPGDRCPECGVGASRIAHALRAVCGAIAAQAGRPRRPSAATAVCALGLGLAAAQAPAQSPLDARLDAAIKRHTLGQFWGAVLVAREGEALLARGYGYANDNLDPITSESLFDIGSVSKMFTAAAILALQDQGKLSTDDTIAKFFPEAGPGAVDITIQHLLTHTSGRSDGRGAIQHLGFDDRDEAVRRFCASAAAAPGGERFEYCNGGYIVLGAIIEQASGRSYEQAVRELVLQPAGMTRSGFLDGEGLDAEQQTLRVTGPAHAARRGLLLDKAVEPWAWGLRGAGGLVTCLDDLLAFDAAIREGRLLSDDARAQWLTPHQANYACGWMISQTDDGRVMHSHGGATRGYMAELRRYPEEGVIIAVLSNEISRNLWPPQVIADALADVLWPPPVLKTSVEIDLSRETLGEYSEMILEDGAQVRALADGAGVRLEVDRDEGAGALLRARMNRAAAERLRNQIHGMLKSGRAPAPDGGLKVGLYGYQYRERMGDAGRFAVDQCTWNVMPSYRGVGEGGRAITDPRLVITLADQSKPGGWFVMIHADDAEAVAIADRLDAALAGEGQ